MLLQFPHIQKSLSLLTVMIGIALLFPKNKFRERFGEKTQRTFFDLGRERVESGRDPECTRPFVDPLADDRSRAIHC